MPTFTSALRVRNECHRSRARGVPSGPRFVAGLLLLITSLLAGTSEAAARQRAGTLRGRVVDQHGALVPNATVTVRNSNGSVKTAAAGRDGEFEITGLAPGEYSLVVTAQSFQPYENVKVTIAAGRQQLDVTLNVAAVTADVTVEPGDRLTPETGAQGGGVVLRDDELDILPDNPDDLVAALQALAGPSVGPDGGQIYIDNLVNTGQPLPPKQTIREIRISQNPFSAENDRLGFGRVEIVTKPGSGDWHTDLLLSFADESLNSRNPFAANRAPYQSRGLSGAVSGPVTKRRTSFFLNASRTETDDNALINAVILDAALRPDVLRQAVLTPQRVNSFGARVDSQLNRDHALTARYSFFSWSGRNRGVGAFSMPERAYVSTNTVQTLYVAETAVVNSRLVNDLRFQYVPEEQVDRGDISRPTINVLNAFVGGGTFEGLAANPAKRLWLQNNTTWTPDPHVLTFGLRLRRTSLSEHSTYNFGGTYIFAGGLAPRLDANDEPVLNPSGGFVLAPITSIERYRRTLLFTRRGLTPAQIRALGGGATQFSIIGGDPFETVRQTDLGLFVQDEWRLRPNLHAIFGLRYDTQTNIAQAPNLAPRLSFAWAPGSAAKGAPTTVIRGGFGLFYDRYDENFTLVTNRYNGINQQQFITTDPSVLDRFPLVTPAAALASGGLFPQTIRRTAPDLRVPYTVQGAVSIEHPLPRGSTLTVSLIQSRTLHAYRSRNINAPLPGTFAEGDPASGARPVPGLGNVFQFEASGRANQRRMVVTLSSRLRKEISLNVNYALAKIMSDTDSLGQFPANSYDASSEYGRSSLDVRHYLTVTAGTNAPLGFRLNGIIVAASGRPFNITTGVDSNGDGQFTERPAFAPDASKPGVVVTRFGTFDPSPAPSQSLIPRNYGRGPSFFSVNLNASRTLRVGPARSGGGSKPGERPYSLTFAVRVQNLLNHTNAAPPVGDLGSSFFGLSTSPAGGFGGGNPAAGNRRVDAQVRFSF